MIGVPINIPPQVMEKTEALPMIDEAENLINESI